MGISINYNANGENTSFRAGVHFPGELIVGFLESVVKTWPR